MCCASAGVRRLHIAGSLRRSYIVGENASYTLKFDANASRFAGVVTARRVSISWVGAVTVDSVGSGLFSPEWLYTLERFSFPILVVSEVGTVAKSKVRGGSVGGPLLIEDSFPELEAFADWCEPCRRRPSIWSGSGESMRARGPAASACVGTDSYKFARIRAANCTDGPSGGGSCEYEPASKDEISLSICRKMKKTHS